MFRCQVLRPVVFYLFYVHSIVIFRSSHPQVFLEKGALKICSKFTGEQTCPSVISIKFLCKFIAITLRHGRSPVNLQHIFRTPFPKTSQDCCFCVFFFAGRKCIDLVVKGREETFAVSCVYIKYLTLARPRKLIAMNFTFFIQFKMHITPVSLKND